MSVPAAVSDITATWLAQALAWSGRNDVGAVSTVRVEPLAHRRGHMSEVVHLIVETERGTLNLVGKLPSPDEAVRAVARRFRLWERECRFYTDLARRLPVRTPECLYSFYDPSTSQGVLILEDLSALRHGDQLAGDLVDINAAVGALGGLHAAGRSVALDTAGWAPRVSDPDFGVSARSLAQVVPRFVEIYGDVLPARAAHWLTASVADPGPLLREPALPEAVLHGDYRLDNLLFDGGAPVVLDWQATAVGSPLYDLACLLGGSLSVAQRRSQERDILDGYRSGLRAAGWDVDPMVLWDAYRRASLTSMLVTTVHVGNAKPVEATARAQLREVVGRVFTAADDLDAMAAL